jgi:sugar-specific transcriptional regulator TrmB
MQHELKYFGLENYESKALEILLKEKLSLRELSRKAKIPFGKIYSVIKGLKEKNLVMENNSRPKLVYVENASEIISRLIKEKQEKEKAMIEKIREIAIGIDKERNRTTKFFQMGISDEERKKIQLRSFEEAEEEVLQILNIYHNPDINRTSKTVYEGEIEKAIGRGVIFKAIYPKNIELPKILAELNKKNPEKFQVKRFNTDFVRCDIIDGKKVLIKLAQKDVRNSGGVLFIENEKLAENLERIFAAFWDQAD